MTDVRATTKNERAARAADQLRQQNAVNRAEHILREEIRHLIHILNKLVENLDQGEAPNQLGIVRENGTRVDIACARLYDAMSTDEA